ncbi:aromatic amino acid ammonia-lyase [Clostridium sp. MSJ-11]|uniref:Aromatic amino acid ammonia-lyase n=1 Tax=Clostridium mobile TaxID=2841512 RepID=A0ABS6EI75_9CLOT|nr:aromatic amino acid ammonia-lyase [Clostridium mobile]MBU5484715.1 aromatic amino acid ammonia-lyase [Clostridium mobile]
MNDNIIKLSGKDLTVEEVDRVSRYGYKIEITEEGIKRLKDSRQLVFDLVDSNIPVYGFNTGVGWNKDKAVFKDFFQEYNTNLIRSHSIAVEPEASIEEVRAVMLVRLNGLLYGCTGIQPEIALMYKEMINREVTPVLPERGSVGEGDIACLSHIGLTMIGEGEAYYKGVKMPALEALQQAGLEPVVLGPKDGLAIVSSNALAAGEGALVIKDVEELLDMADIIYALSLEGLNGNTSPLDKNTHKVRPFPGQSYSAERITKYLEGSYVWNPNWKKALQDPLSYRGSAHIHGSIRDALDYVKKYLTIQMNSSDDNPCLLLDERVIVSCSNFEPTTWVLGFEMLGIALGHLSKVSCYRSIKLGDPDFTGLPRFLAPSDNVLSFATLQKTYTALDAEIRHLSNPATTDFFSLAGDIEDHANNSPYVVQKTRKIVDNIRYILGIEAIHAVQAIDLRKDIHLGKGTKIAYDIIRKEIPFYDKDRNISIDIKKAYELMKNKKILSEVLKVIK